MKAKLIAKLVQAENWLAQAKNWQLRLTVAVYFIPFLLIAFLASGGVNFAAMAFIAAAITVFSPNLRSKIIMATKQQLVIAAVIFPIALWLTIFASPFVVWGYELNKGMFFMASAASSLSQTVAKSLNPKSGAPKKKKPNKRDKKRYGKK